MIDDMLDKIEQWYYRGEYGRVIYHCDLCLNESEFQSQRALLLLIKGLAHEKSGPAWAGQAMSAYRDGIEAARKDPIIKAKLIIALGCLYTRTGDCTSYEPLLREYQQLEQKGNFRVRQLSVEIWFNYGVVLDNAYRWAEAAAAFVRAATLAEEFQLSDWRGQSLHNLGGCQLALGQIAEAALSMSQAEPLINDDLHGHKKLSRRAEYALASGDLISAQQWITAALLHARVDDRTRADVHYTWAQTLRALGRPEEAKEIAWKGLDFAVRAVYYPGIHKLNRFVQEFDG